MFAISQLLKRSTIPAFRLELSAGFKFKAPKTPGNGYNVHRSNRAKEGISFRLFRYLTLTKYNFFL